MPVRDFGERSPPSIRRAQATAVRTAYAHGAGRNGTVRRWAGALPALLLWVWLVLPAYGAPVSYTIDPQAGSLQLLVQRAGVLAVLAHDHVLVAEGYAGRIVLDTTALAGASLQISVPVAALRVDPPQARAELGLAGELDDDDRREIRDNLLAPQQLDAGQFPRVIATLEGISGVLPDVTLALRVRIKQTEQVLTVPARVEATPRRLEASGAFDLLQSAFGIEAYSALLGAIAVEDRVRVRFRIVALAERP